MINLKAGIIIAGMLVSTAIFSQSTNWKVDTNKATIKFITSGPFGEVDGSLAGLKATIIFDPKSPEKSSMNVTINPATIETGVSLRNTHLREKDEFFNRTKYPVISFKSKQIRKTATGSYVVSGDLMIKTVVKQIDIPFTFDKTSTGGIFKGSFTMDAMDYQLGKSSKNVTVNIEVPVIQ